MAVVYHCPHQIFSLCVLIAGLMTTGICNQWFWIWSCKSLSCYARPLAQLKVYFFCITHSTLSSSSPTLWSNSALPSTIDGASM